MTSYIHHWKPHVSKIQYNKNNNGEVLNFHAEIINNYFNVCQYHTLSFFMLTYEYNKYETPNIH